jgi:hypothetical protein
MGILHMLRHLFNTNTSAESKVLKHSAIMLFPYGLLLEAKFQVLSRDGLMHSILRNMRSLNDMCRDQPSPTVCQIYDTPDRLADAQLYFGV